MDIIKKLMRETKIGNPNYSLQLSDWNMQDKFYEVPPDILKEFKKRILASGIKKNWEWFVNQVDFKTKETKGNPIKTGRIDMTGGIDYFLDWSDAKSTVKEWDI